MARPKKTANLLLLFCFFAFAYVIVFFSLKQVLSHFTDRLIHQNVAQTNLTEEEEKIAYLTFDDGPSKNTEKVLSILDEYGIKATFFVNYRETSYYAPTLQKLVEEGHNVGNHTYSHNFKIIYKSSESFYQDFQKLQTKIFEITGKKPDIFRFPGGSMAAKNYFRFNGADLSIFNRMEEEGYAYYDWNVDASDQTAPFPSGQMVAKRILNQTKHLSTAMILLHDSPTSQNIVNALPAIIKGMLNQGFTFRRLDSGITPIAQFVYPKND